ncbi:MULTISPECIES: hypothetical protein [Streptomyces]|uniref:GntR-family protein transcriptional regulator n=1 Tax=Streptomyces sviceus (strain ATCC 29083 / DSM 924 / JCM 4929 / NBRC 13980 / NCIMB 11184 / NRRL 5439 / UC 5370) TaxID=463191 RepID=B5I855_STRX2|nr:MULTISPECIES: hypothetical protein [Streptomyces]EDY61259.1 GntR-family protein transcriptional regulator [Streptomyces sviceus ATCC 29083]
MRDAERLQTAGWVDPRPSQRAFVHSPTTEKCAQLLSVRGLLETHFARGGAQHTTPGDTARLWELQQTGLTALAATDARALVEANAGNEHARIIKAIGEGATDFYCRQIAAVAGRGD